MKLKDTGKRNKALVLIFILTYIIYGNSIKNKYAFDDDYVTVTTPNNPNNSRIEKGIYGIPEIFSTHYVELKQQSFEYRPVVLSSFAIEYQLFGSNPYISHFINVLLFALSNCMLFLLLRKLFNSYSDLFPLLVIVLFIVHPIHTEVVANIKCRDELLSLLFGLLSTLMLFRFHETKKWYYLIFAVVGILAGILCKKTAELFIFFAPFTLYFFSGIKPKHLLLYGCILYSSLIFFNFIESSLVEKESELRSYAFFENPLFYKTDLLSRLPIALYSTGYYIKLLMIPFPLSCYYGYSVIPDANWNTPFVILSLLFYSGITVYAIKRFKKRDILSYCIIIFLIGIYPFSNLFYTPTGIVADRYIYFASIPFCIAIIYIFFIAFKIDFHKPLISISVNRKFYFSFILLLSVYAFLSILRNTKWKDEMTLLKNDVKHFPNSCNLNYITGNKLYTQIFGMADGPKKESLVNETKFYFKQAVSLMEDGIKKFPGDFTTLNNIGTIYVNIFNAPQTAQPYFIRSLAVKPDNEQALYNSAFCYEKRGLTDSAILSYENLIAKNSDYMMAYVQLKQLYLGKHMYSKAINCDKKIIEKNPDNAKLYIDLGNTYINNKDTLKAIDQFIKAVKTEPGNQNLKTQIIDFLTRSGHSEKLKELENN